MHRIRHSITHCIQAVLTRTLLASLTLAPMHGRAITSQYDTNIFASNMSERVFQEIFKPLHKLQKKADLSLNDIARCAIQIKTNADQVVNTQITYDQLIDQTVSILKKEYKAHVSKSKVKQFKKLLKKHESKSGLGWIPGLNLGYECLAQESQKEEEETLNVPVALAVLEGICGCLAMIVGGYLYKSGFSKMGDYAVTFGTGLMTHAGTQLFTKETYEEEPKKHKKDRSHRSKDLRNDMLLQCN